MIVLFIYYHTTILIDFLCVQISLIGKVFCQITVIFTSKQEIHMKILDQKKKKTLKMLVNYTLPLNYDEVIIAP